MLRIEPLNKHHDQAPSAILELVDGPRDMRFAMTAKSLLREREAATNTTTTAATATNKSTATATEGEEAVDMGIRDITAKNVLKVTRYRAGGETDLQREVERLEAAERGSGKRDDDADEFEVLQPAEEARRPDWRRYGAFDAQERKKRRTVHKIKTIREKDRERKRLRD